MHFALNNYSARVYGSTIWVLISSVILCFGTFHGLCNDLDVSNAPCLILNSLFLPLFSILFFVFIFPSIPCVNTEQSCLFFELFSFGNKTHYVL